MFNLEQIEAKLNQNREAGRDENDGLSSAEIGAYNRSFMFGTCDADEWDADEWSRIVD